MLQLPQPGWAVGTLKSTLLCTLASILHGFAALLTHFLAHPPHSPSAGNLLRGLVSCTGAQFCSLALVETKNRALEVRIGTALHNVASFSHPALRSCAALLLKCSVDTTTSSHHSRLALQIVRKLEAELDIPRLVRMHWTGCPNSCGQARKQARRAAQLGLACGPGKLGGQRG